MSALPELDLAGLYREAAAFGLAESTHPEPTIYGATDGKAVGTYLEHKFQAYLATTYRYDRGNSALGIDFPSIEVDLKVTSVRQPQSSSPFRSARQKIFGLGYHLLVFVYAKTDDDTSRTSTLDIKSIIFVDKTRTADFQVTQAIINILSNGGNEDDLIAYFSDRNLPVDDIVARDIARELLESPPLQGYITISNALQWRLQYGHALTAAGSVDGVLRLR